MSPRVNVLIVVFIWSAVYLPSLGLFEIRGEDYFWMPRFRGFTARPLFSSFGTRLNGLQTEKPQAPIFGNARFPNDYHSSQESRPRQ